MLYEYCTSKDEFEQEIKNNFFNNNERKNIEKAGLEMIFTNKINSNWKRLQFIKNKKLEEKKGKEKEEVKKNEEKFALFWDKYFKNQIEILKDLDRFKVENELKNIERKAEEL